VPAYLLVINLVKRLKPLTALSGTVSLSAVNGLSRLTKLTTSKEAGTADSIRKFSNRPITCESNR